MTNLSDFLKVEKVRCVSIGNYKFITVGKEYDVVGLTRNSVFIVNDYESENLYPYKHFEPVLDSAENPLQKMELTPEFGASEPTFKVGNKVYKYGETDVKTVLEVFENGHMNISNYPHRVNHEVICHATPENHALLSKPFPAIEFEQPPKKLTGSDLCRAMLEKGWNLVPCVVSDTSDNEALLNDDCQLIDEWYNGYFECNGNRFKYAVPFDPRTGEPLTESILND